MAGKGKPKLGKVSSGMSMEEIETSMEDLGDFNLTPEEAKRFERAIAIAEGQIQEARVSFRWRPASLDVVKQAAARVGVPYQTYMKVVTYQRALADLEKAPGQRQQKASPRRKNA